MDIITNAVLDISLEYLIHKRRLIGLYWLIYGAKISPFGKKKKKPNKPIYADDNLTDDFD